MSKIFVPLRVVCTRWLLFHLWLHSSRKEQHTFLLGYIHTVLYIHVATGCGNELLFSSDRKRGDSLTFRWVHKNLWGLKTKPPSWNISLNCLNKDSHILGTVFYDPGKYTHNKKKRIKTRRFYIYIYIVSFFFQIFPCIILRCWTCYYLVNEHVRASIVKRNESPSFGHVKPFTSASFTWRYWRVTRTVGWPIPTWRVKRKLDSRIFHSTFNMLGKETIKK